jgi:hypothetical protein
MRRITALGCVAVALFIVYAAVRSWRTGTGYELWPRLPAAYLPVIYWDSGLRRWLFHSAPDGAEQPFDA